MSTNLRVRKVACSGNFSGSFSLRVLPTDIGRVFRKSVKYKFRMPKDRVKPVKSKTKRRFYGV